MENVKNKGDLKMNENKLTGKDLINIGMTWSWWMNAVHTS